MYLMMEYNDGEYLKFLKVVHYWKLHFICCKYRFIIKDQLKELQEFHDEDDGDVVMKDETIGETQDASLPAPLPKYKGRWSVSND